MKKIAVLSILTLFFFTAVNSQNNTSNKKKGTTKSKSKSIQNTKKKSEEKEISQEENIEQTNLQEGDSIQSENKTIERGKWYVRFKANEPEGSKEEVKRVNTRGRAFSKYKGD